jgi:hypothetical protein
MCVIMAMIINTTNFQPYRQSNTKFTIQKSKFTIQISIKSVGLSIKNLKKSSDQEEKRKWSSN